MDKFVNFILSHPVLITLLAVVMLLVLLEEKRGSVKGLGKLAPQDVIRYINHEGAKIVDLRNSTEFNAGHIVDSTNIPYQELDSNTRKLNKYKSKPVILVCTSGQNAIKAGVKLQQLGLTQLFILQGGITAWKRAELPLSKA